MTPTSDSVRETSDIQIEDGASTGSPGARPIGAREFDILMRGVGPFERRPAIAVAVSGGADSLALALLCASWARRRGGTAVGLTVDHRLRPESGGEARRVKSWLKAHDMPHHILTWAGPAPATGIEAAARDARYALLNGWCRRHAVLHLLLGHHREDQAETYLMRLARGSGPIGLAGMSAVTETAHGRLLRPLLTVSRARLRRTLEVRRQPWIEDPSNQDIAFTRVRIRRSMPRLAAAGMTAEAIATATANAARLRSALETETARLLAEAAEIFPAGYGCLHLDPFERAPRMIAISALAAMVTCIGGRAYGPRTDRLDRLYEAIRGTGGWRGRTLSGCVIAPRHGHLLIAREPAKAIETVPLAAGDETIWDGRFRVRVARTPRVAADLRLGRLGEDGWARLVRADPSLKQTEIPAAARAALPAIRDRRGVVLVPSFPNVRLTRRNLPAIDVRFCPANPLAKSMFSVV